MTTSPAILTSGLGKPFGDRTALDGIDVEVPRGSAFGFLGIEPQRKEGPMRKLVVTENITLDGVIDMAEGWFDPLNADVDQSDITAVNTQHQEAADALLVGRNSVWRSRPQRRRDPYRPQRTQPLLLEGMRRRR